MDQISDLRYINKSTEKENLYNAKIDRNSKKFKFVRVNPFITKVKKRTRAKTKRTRRKSISTFSVFTQFSYMYRNLCVTLSPSISCELDRNCVICIITKFECSSNDEKHEHHHHYHRRCRHRIYRTL